MKKCNVLYQVKILERLVARKFLKDEKIEIEDIPKKIPSPAQIEMIDYILEHREEEIYQKDLEKIFNLRRSTISGILQTMEKNGLIERITDANDTRTKKIVLNQKAKKIFNMNQKKIEEITEVVTKDISEEELEIFSKIIEKMKINLEEV